MFNDLALVVRGESAKQQLNGSIGKVSAEICVRYSTVANANLDLIRIVGVPVDDPLALQRVKLP